jgi:hypothetical protein
MSASSKLQKGLSRLEKGLGNPSFTFKGQKIPCTPATTKSQRRGEFGGFDDNVDFSLTIRKNIFISVDDVDVTFPNNIYQLDRYGNVVPNYDSRRNTIDAWVAARRALLPDSCVSSIIKASNDIVTIDDDVATINVDEFWPYTSAPTLDSISITIDDNLNVTVDGYTPGSSTSYFSAIRGQSPVTIDATDLTLDNNDATMTIDRHIDIVGYYDPIILPDLNNVYLAQLNADIERAKELLNVSTDFSLTVGTGLPYDNTTLTIDDIFRVTIDMDDDVTIDGFTPSGIGSWERPARVAGVYQEDQHLDWGRRPKQGEIIEYEGKQYRVIGEEDPGAFSAFFKLRLESALR